MNLFIEKTLKFQFLFTQKNKKMANQRLKSVLSNHTSQTAQQEIFDVYYFQSMSKGYIMDPKKEIELETWRFKNLKDAIKSCENTLVPYVVDKNNLVMSEYQPQSIFLSTYASNEKILENLSTQLRKNQVFNKFIHSISDCDLDSIYCNQFYKSVLSKICDVESRFYQEQKNNLIKNCVHLITVNSILEHIHSEDYFVQIIYIVKKFIPAIVKKIHF